MIQIANVGIYGYIRISRLCYQQNTERDEEYRLHATVDKDDRVHSNPANQLFFNFSRHTHKCTQAEL